ncbi:MAG: 3-oxoacyl-[acyl-carrier-protein] reductase [Eubacteriales Family XIII. Incertae Sedis bacterium]|nr:MAG: 3-oxoacyl-[acyl-carrier-protein] reductase [Clostridiales Family XIII bacterium]
MLKEKVAVITGGSRGIGAEVAYKLASLGADIAIIYAGNEEAANKVAERCENEYSVKVRTYRCNVADFDEVKTTVGQIKADFGTVNILVNSAGITRDTLVTMMSEKDFDDVLDTNLKGTFNMIRHCSGFFIRNREGSIINISSVSGLMGNAGQTNYSASKAGIVGLTKSVAKELAPRGIRCNAVAPGFIATDMTKDLGDGAEKLMKMIPLGRIGKPQEVAEAVAFLACAEYITGEVIRVDGGIAM